MGGILNKLLKGDRIIWLVIGLLSMVSLLAVYSSTGTLAYRFQEGNTAHYILKHAIILFMGLGIIYLTYSIPYKYYSRLSQIFLFGSILLLILTLMFGTSINQATRWLALPGLGLTIQTSDFAKLALIMYLARLLSQKQDEIKDLKLSFIPIILPVLLVSMLILPSNLSTALIIMATSVVLMYIGRVRTLHLVALISSGILVIGIFIGIVMYGNLEGRFGTWKNRIESFVGGEGDNFQASQSKIAIASGGLIGKGPGNSTQRNFLPHSYSDFIYAIIVEEYGLIGGLLVLAFYLWLLYRAGVIVRRSTRTFPALLAIGLTLGIVIQAMINMAVVVGLFPVTGQQLPLVSMGGSSLVFTSVALGIILSVSHGVEKNEEIETNEAPKVENNN